MGNPNPVQGFHTRPHDINLAGRPKKDWTWAGLIEEEVEKYDEADSALPQEKRAKIKNKVVKKIIGKALDGDIGAFTALANRTDGNPTENKNISGVMVVAPLLPEQQAQLARLLDENYDEEKYPDAIEAEAIPDGGSAEDEEPTGPPEADYRLVDEKGGMAEADADIRPTIEAPAIEENAVALPSESEKSTTAPHATD